MFSRKALLTLLVLVAPQAAATKTLAGLAQVVRADVACEFGAGKSVLTVAVDLGASVATASCLASDGSTCPVASPSMFQVMSVSRSEGLPTFAMVRGGEGLIVVNKPGLAKLVLEGRDQSGAAQDLVLRFALGGDGVTNVLTARAVLRSAVEGGGERLLTAAYCRVQPRP